MRIVVTGRSNPPIPGDVPADHPLREQEFFRVLDRSPHAEVIRQDAQRELKKLLYGSQIEQDLLGLLTAAGGGLSSSDLAELTGSMPGQIDEHLRATSARSFIALPGRGRASTASVYMLGHDELQQQASEFLGHIRLDAYRDRLHAWADTYRERHWPSGTPEYLLRGYFRLLYTTGDILRMLTYAVDSNRHDRMLDITGGDAVALAEIATAQEFLLGGHEPDLLAMARLAIYRDGLTRRNGGIPTDLPAVWYMLGYPDRAENLADSITRPDERARALATIAQAAVAAGEIDEARSLIERAVAIANSLTDRWGRERVLTEVVSLAVAVGAMQLAEAALQSIRDDYRWTQAIVAAVRVAAIAGNVERADALLLLAGSSYTQGPTVIAEASAAIAEAVAASGDLDRAAALVEPISVPAVKAQALTALASAAGGTGDIRRARSLLDEAIAVSHMIDDVAGHAMALAQVGRVAAVVDEISRSDELVEQAMKAASSIDEPFSRSVALRAVADVIAAKGDSARAKSVAASISDQYTRRRALAQVAHVAASTGDIDTAEDIARSIDDTFERTAAVIDVARTAAELGNLDQAETIVSSLSDGLDDRARALAALAGVAVAAGNFGRGRALAEQAETLARANRHHYGLDEAMLAITRAAGAAGYLGFAETVARSIGHDARHVQALAAVAEAAFTAGRSLHGRSLVKEADASARLIYHDGWQDDALHTIAEVLVTIGSLDRAEVVAQSIAGSWTRAQTLFTLSRATADAGNVDRANDLAEVAVNLARTIESERLRERSWETLAELRVRLAFAVKADLDDAEAAVPNFGSFLFVLRGLATVAELAASIGDHDRARRASRRAEALLRSVADSGIGRSDFSDESAILAEIMFHAGDIERAEATAISIGSAEQQAATLAWLANKAPSERVRQLVALALRVGPWTTPLTAIARIQPDVVPALAHDFLKQAIRDS
jgi:tetratricopeptide (TPR) repeat protein